MNWNKKAKNFLFICNYQLETVKFMVADQFQFFSAENNEGSTLLTVYRKIFAFNWYDRNVYEFYQYVAFWSKDSYISNLTLFSCYLFV